MINHSFFTSAREKMLWICVLIILIGIFLSLIIGRPFLELLKDQELQAGIFLFGMIVIGICVVLYGIMSKPKMIELTLILGIIAVYSLLFLRLGLPERSHLIEYSALSLTIHQALLERQKQGKRIRFLSFYTLLIAVSIGIIDETIQLLLPERVFDINDIIFNCLAILLAIGVSMSLKIVKRRIRKENNGHKT